MVDRTKLPHFAGFLIAAALAHAVAGGGATASAQVFTVGHLRDVDSMNPTVGVSPAAFEAWNIHYATLTERSAKDLSAAPGLAESWERSADGRTWTYELRPGLKWSDGKPLTAADVAYTINRARREEWVNHRAAVASLAAKAIGPTTVRVESEAPDPRLPAIDVQIVPRHVYERYGSKALGRYDGEDGVGSGPYTLTRFRPGRSARFAANPRHWRGKPPLKAVVLRDFDDPRAMAAALRAGAIDAAHGLTRAAYDRLQGVAGIEVVEGGQGAFNQLALNGGDGLREGHPALADPRVRRAIAHALDKQAIVDRVEHGHATVADTVSPSADPAWTPQIPDGEKLAFDLDRARALLDAGGYEDADGDGVRELPGGGRPLRLRYAVRSDSPASRPTAALVAGWLQEIGIATTRELYDDDRLTEAIGRGDYDMFVWGWAPSADPGPMLSYFTCDQVSRNPDHPTDGFNDANLCDRGYDELYERQQAELDPAKRRAIVHEMLARFARTGVYDVLYTYPELQAYRTDRFEGFVRQPAGVGPVLFSTTSPTYARLRPLSARTGGGAGGDGLGVGAPGIAAIAALALGGAWALARRRVRRR
jgi:peptide/nickel transport system substrate-binding protein